jgi:hypothetical protein
MSAEIESLDDARRAKVAERQPALQTPSDVALRYIRHAEESLALMGTLESRPDRAAVCRITVTWLKLAEASLSSQRLPD